MTSQWKKKSFAILVRFFYKPSLKCSKEIMVTQYFSHFQLVSVVHLLEKAIACAPQNKLAAINLRPQQSQLLQPPQQDPYFQQRPQTPFGSSLNLNLLKLLFASQASSTPSFNLNANSNQNRNYFQNPFVQKASSTPNENFLHHISRAISPSASVPHQQSRLPHPPNTITTQSTLASLFDRQTVKAPCPATTAVQNKQLVVVFYQKTLGNKNLDDLEQYLLPSYIQHNPNVPDGIEGFKSLFTTGPLRGHPKTQVDFKRVSAEGDLVWIHSRLSIGGKNFTVMDIFRIECGKIAEHWDSIQEITPSIIRNSKNAHPFF
jgi:predicted SnoaL-like aldol condensation-catalyzing enzyme